jgi:hypothetical protein
MKLFIFTPSEFWDYCGGACMATAGTFEEAVARLSAIDGMTDHHFYRTQPPKPAGFGASTCDIWVLKAELDLAPNQSVVTLTEYNYA